MRKNLTCLIILLYSTLTSAKLPEGFLWGGAICEQQNSGAENLPNSQWSAFEKQKGVIQTGEESGKSCNFWEFYRHDIALMSDFGLNSLRFSVAWDKIEPQEGVFDETAIQHYIDICQLLLENNMTPMITLHHFAHPIWFEEKGAFEKEENIKYFLRFSQKVFVALSDKVKLWCTINEPNIYAFQGYLMNAFPPKKLWNAKAACIVLKNLIKAHCDLYDLLKSLPNGQDCQIGFVHQYLKFMPYHKYESLLGKFCELFFIGEKVMPYLLNNFLNDAIMNFLKTGNFEICIPGLPNKPTLISKINKNYVQSYKHEGKIADFIGLNFYSMVVIELYNLIVKQKPAAFDHQVMTQLSHQFLLKRKNNALQTTTNKK